MCDTHMTVSFHHHPGLLGGVYSQVIYRTSAGIERMARHAKNLLLPMSCALAAHLGVFPLEAAECSLCGKELAVIG